ncbi:MAG: cytochrome c biogenesis protein CcsA [Parachlamydiales bacterium]|jgi:ABC-type transport system involved in cytochrome c biogenesis permease subunit
MKFIFTLFFSLLLPVLAHADINDIPVHFNGRYRPYAALEKDERLKPLDEILTLPNRHTPSFWEPLKKISLDQKNFTAYSDKSYAQIHAAYSRWLKAADPLSGIEAEELTQALLGGYAEIASKPYLKSVQKELRFPSLTQLKAEKLYVTVPWVKVSFILFTLAAIICAYGHLSFAKWAASIGFSILTVTIALRMYILQRPPVSNMTETLLFVPWIAVLVGLVFKKEALLISTSLAALLLGISIFAKMGHALENVQAVLDSNYWLTIHVLLVVGSYALFLLSGLAGHAYLAALAWNKQGQLNPWAKLVKNTSYLGLGMLIPGTILGGIWAAQSWGRFWDWDPKESWAFITILAYLIGLHAYRYKVIGDKGLALSAIIGAWAVTFTWYGVNYILGTGLHSYGFGNGGEWFYAFAILADAIVVGYLYCYSTKKWAHE